MLAANLSILLRREKGNQGKKEEMEAGGGGEHEQMVKSRVMKVESEESWKYFVSQAVPVVVHFTAAWCMPSVAMNSVFEELAWIHQDALFLLVDVDDMKEVASKMEVKAMPTFLVMKEGVQVDKVVGANSDEISKRIKAAVVQ